ncbi:MAG: hypothetical protein JW818_09750 [Pirellulales bacterium]|nr:hypothetical protein [Pirellulales bacterium]
MPHSRTEQKTLAWDALGHGPCPPVWPAFVLMLGMLLMAGAGCNRAYYRRQADREVHDVVACAATQADSDRTDYSIRPNPASRMFDPDCPDCPPMPPDDPAAARLMRCVDGKHGWPGWDCYGKTPLVENPDWESYLPRDENGVVVLDREGAVQLALVNSRDYQQQLENLYVSALDVTFQRFRFDAQFFGGNSTFYDAQGRVFGGGAASSTLQTDTELEMRKLYASGGELVVGMANSLVWQFAGPDDYAGTTLLDFSLVQPLLRAGGRAVALEELTDAERALLANIRQMERFRRGFYTQVVAGSDPGPGPSRGGPSLGGLNPGGGAGTSGLMGLLRQQVVIRNQRANIVSLNESLQQLEAFFQANWIDFFQVEQTRLQLYQAQIDLLNREALYEDTLDAYKIQLGLPPTLDVRIADPLLNQFDLIAPELTDAQNAATLLLEKVRNAKPGDSLVERIPAMQALAKVSRTQYRRVARDLTTLDTALPARRKALEQLAQRDEFRRGDVAASICDVTRLDKRVAKIHVDYADLECTLEATLDKLAAWEQRIAQGPDAKATEDNVLALEGDLLALSGQLLELSLTQAKARLESITLAPLELNSDDAFQIARANRRDWKNARSALVDQWRQVEVTANDLESDLDLTFSGDLGTTGEHPLRFRGTNGRLRVGLAWDAPLTRLAERNTYREALISYQQARRSYYAYEDRVSQSLRRTLRDVRLAQINFEQRRAAVLVAARQVDLKQFDLLNQPPQAGGGRSFGSTTARDVVDALNNLFREQNDFLDVWVSYEILRMNLAFDLGVMRLDDRGMWIDEDLMTAVRNREQGSSCPDSDDPPLEFLPKRPAVEEIPAPPPQEARRVSRRRGVRK